MEFIILIGYGMLERLTIKLFKLPKQRSTWLWATLLMVLSFWNLGFYWYCYVLIVWMLLSIGLIFLQPNLSTSLVTMVIFLCMLFAAGLSYRWILGALAVVVPCGALFIYLLVV